jgi:hypothetical protein
MAACGSDPRDCHVRQLDPRKKHQAKFYNPNLIAELENRLPAT